jgi:hypothetical protein
VSTVWNSWIDTGTTGHGIFHSSLSSDVRREQALLHDKFSYLLGFGSERNTSKERDDLDVLCA